MCFPDTLKTNKRLNLLFCYIPRVRRHLVCIKCLRSLDASNEVNGAFKRVVCKPQTGQNGGLTCGLSPLIYVLKNKEMHSSPFYVLLHLPRLRLQAPYYVLSTRENYVWRGWVKRPSPRHRRKKNCPRICYCDV